MDAHTDSPLTQGNTIHTTLAENITVDHERDSSNIALNEDSVPGNLSTSNVHLNLVTDSGDIEAHEGQSSIHPFKVQPHSQGSLADYPHCVRAYMQSDQEHGCINSQNNSNQVVLPVISEEVPLSEHTVVPAGGSTASAINISVSEVPTIVHSQEPPLSYPRIASATAPRDEREGEADPDDPLSCTQTDLDRVHGAGLSRLTHEEEIREDFDYPCEGFPSSLPPSSSPPQLFSSSPCASSQSSVSGVEPSKMVLEGSPSSRDRPHADHVALVTQDESRLESKHVHDHDTVDVTTSTETDKYCSEMDPTSCVEGSPEPPKKRMIYQSDADESYGSQPTKRPKLDSHLYLPPAPMRATLASQERQFKKLAAPFRPPSKLPVARDELAQTMHNGAIESASSSTPEIDHDKPDLREPTTHVLPLQHKASNTSRSIAQFKSPLVNRVLPADSRTIRLTPALQALERKLQLLKRAIKVKEDSEEEVLVRLAGKWIEAGRDVACDVWDATKDAGNFEGKATLVRRSYGWEGTNDGNMPWGWDTKLGNAGEESCDRDPSMAPCVAGRLAPEEDDEVGFNNTLGTMLHQLGIAPEIFGWDDDKETFSD